MFDRVARSYFNFPVPVEMCFVSKIRSFLENVQSTNEKIKLKNRKRPSRPTKMGAKRSFLVAALFFSDRLCLLGTNRNAAPLTRFPGSC